MMMEYQAGRLPLERLTASVQGWANYVRYGNTVGLQKAVLGRHAILQYPSGRSKKNLGGHALPHP